MSELNDFVDKRLAAPPILFADDQSGNDSERENDLLSSLRLNGWNPESGAESGTGSESGTGKESKSESGLEQSSETAAATEISVNG